MDSHSSLHYNVESYEVAIIGLGPVGGVLANILGHYQINTIILDQEGSPYRLPRAVAFDDEIMRIFQALGLSTKINEIATVGGDALFVDSTGKTLMNWKRPQLPSSNKWYYNYRFHQPDLENILREGFRRFPTISERWGCKVTRLTQDEEGVNLVYLKENSKKQFGLRAAYVIGCDGANSFTRSCIGSGIQDLGFRESWLVTDLKLNKPEPAVTRDSCHYCEPKRAATYVFVGNKRKRWEFRLNADDDPNEIKKPPEVWRLLERWIKPDRARLERAIVYTFQSTIADTWRKGRIMIAGDAAHQTPPFMGQGMCAGIRDTFNLGWKLERILKHGVSDNLLETYQIERLPHVKQFIEITIQMGQIINQTTTEILSGIRTDPNNDQQTIRQLKPKLGPGLSAGLTKWNGHLFPQPRLQSGMLLDDQIGNRAALIFAANFFKTLPDKLIKKVEALDIAVIYEPSPELISWFRDKKVNAVLIRPDRYVVGCAVLEADLTKLVKWIRKFFK